MLLYQPIFDFGISRLETLSFIALCIVLFAALRLRWWFGPTLVVLVSGAVCMFLYYNGVLRESVDYCIAFVQWLISGAQEHELFGMGSEMELLTFAVMFTVTLVVFAFLRRFISVWLFIAMFCTVVFLYLTDDFEQLVPVFPLSLFMTGIVALLPRSYIRSVKKHKETGVARTYAEITAIPVAVLAVFLSLIISPQSDSYIRLRPLYNTFQDIGHYFGHTRADMSTNFEIHKMGFGSSSERLGGPVELRDGYILTVVTKRPALLTGAVLDYYTGYRWLPSDDDRSIRYNSFLWRSERDHVFGFDKPNPGNVYERRLDPQLYYHSISEHVTLDITYASEYFNTLFSTAGMESISFSTRRLNDDIYFNARSELYAIDPVPPGEVLTITGRVLNWNDPHFKQTFTRLEEVVFGDSFFDEIYERYTVLPESLPDSVRETAQNVVAGEISPFLKAYALAQWLGENFYYTLEPVVPPEDIDVVAHFLETGE